MSKFVKLFLMALVVISCSKEPEPKPTTPLSIATSDGEVKFSVEVANTPQDLQVGLMNRKTLAFNSGMIFNIYPVRPTAMWMKDTKIPLDMLFIAPDGTVSLIFENTTPMSEELLISRDPVRAVLELNAGQVKRHNIKIGDKVTHTLLNSMLDTAADAKPAVLPAPAAATPDIAVPELSAEEVPAIEAPAEAEPSLNSNEVPEVPGLIEVPSEAPQPKLPVPAPTF